VAQKQALLERLQQQEEKVLRRAKVTYVEDYQATKHCLEITMPAVYEAYEQSARTRGLSPEVFGQMSPDGNLQQGKKHG
jgi:hypothetical protein